MRRDQHPARRYRSGSGLPSPCKGSRITASTKSSTRSAVFRSALTQNCKSSRNSGWKIAARLASRFTEHLSPQLRHRTRPLFAAFRSLDRPKQTPRIPWRAQQVSGLDQPGEFVGGNKRHIARSSAPHDYRLLLVHHPVENASQILAKTRIGCFRSHRIASFLLYSFPVQLAAEQPLLRLSARHHQELAFLSHCRFRRPPFDSCLEGESNQCDS